MGVPKFYRWISERYPCLSTVAREYQLPDFDNLYLDMNGIIHVCSHPNDSDAHFRISEEEIFKNIFEYIDFIFRMVKPNKCFFMAVDGVAPRAKMNQQRDRRFRSAKEAEESEKAAKKKGEELPTEKRFDSNCISPGTEFMEKLHEQLKYFVAQKLSEDPVWQKEGLKIYLSGHDSPGEGEHKAMDFIRYLRSQEGYDPNTRHCIYGQDADLIMLALCTHEPHIALLREEVVFGKQATKRVQSADKVTFHLLHINLLREYLDHEFAELKKPGVLKMEYNLEKIIDDWLLMCFLVGNDFLPHLPNLHIAHDALPILHKTYCAVLPLLDGYLHEQGKLNLKNFEVFMKRLGERDLEMFERIEEKHPDGMEKLGKEEMDDVRKRFPDLDIPDMDSEEDDIWEEEFRQHKRHYYMTKMDYPEVTDAVLREQAEGYIRAVQWNLHYYYNGVQSWSWYYPHHYSPYISDIKNFGNLKVNFELGKPFLPFQQLVSIMPAASKELVPQAYRSLMTEDTSPLKKYFPDDFDTDLNGKTQEWEAVVLIKYIEEDILLNSMKQYDHMLTDTEKKRNKHGVHLVYEYSPKPLGSYPSPIPGSKMFPSIVNNHAKCSELPSDTFRIHPSAIKKGRLPNTRESYYYPGFPSLRHLPHTAELSLQGCRIFQQPSRSYNMILRLDEIPPDLESYASLLGKTIHINYPHLRQAKVSKIANDKFIVTSDGKKKCSEIESKDIPKKVDSLKMELKYRWGINVGDSGKLLIYCRPIVGRKYIYQGESQVTIEKQWSDVDVPVLHNTVISDLQEHEIQPAQVQTVQEVFANNKTVFLMNQNEYGMQGRVNGHLPGGNILIESAFREEPNFGEVRNREHELRKTDYLPTFRLSRELGIENHLFSRLTGCVQVQLNSKEAETSQTVNIGLNLRFNKKNEEVIGYSKRFKTKEGRLEWRFSMATITAIRELFDRYGHFFERLRNCMTMDKIPLDQCFGAEDYREALNTVREIAKYIKDQPFSKAPHQKSGGIVLDEGVVEAVQRVVDKYLKKPTSLVNLRVSPKDLYIPGLHLGLFAPDPKAYFCLYDRVVNVRIDITIPLGLKGTIIGIHRSDDETDDREATYEVLFDSEFPTGTQTRGAKGKRVAVLSNVSMINISHGRRMVELKQQNEEALRQGHGAWGSQSDTRVKVMSRRKKAQSPPQPVIPVTKNKQNEQEAPSKTSQEWFDPAWAQMKIAKKNDNHSGKQPRKEESKKDTRKLTSEKNKVSPTEGPNILQQLFKQVEGVQASQGINDPAIVASSTSVPLVQGIQIKVEDLFAAVSINKETPPPEKACKTGSKPPTNVPQSSNTTGQHHAQRQRNQPYENHHGNQYRQQRDHHHFQHQYHHHLQHHHHQQGSNHHYQQANNFHRYNNYSRFNGGGYNQQRNHYYDPQFDHRQRDDERRHHQPAAHNPFIPTQVMRLENSKSQNQSSQKQVKDDPKTLKRTEQSTSDKDQQQPQVRGPMWRVEEDANVTQKSERVKPSQQPPQQPQTKPQTSEIETVELDNSKPNQAVRKRVGKGPRLGATFGSSK